MGSTFYIHTYGCQMNRRDSEAVSALLERHGMTAVPEQDADILLVNTCSVREKAEDKALGKLGLMVATKRDRPDRKVGVMGCVVQRLGAAMFDRIPGLDFAVGTRRYGAIPGVVDRVRAGQGPVLEDALEDTHVDALSGHHESGISAYVNILFGCERRCTYCIVPDVRGPEWSRPAASILDEIRNLASAGVREVTLLGQSVMMYGRRNRVWDDRDEASPNGFTEPLARLLEAVDAIEGVDRIRFTSGHPSGCTNELIRAMAALRAVCPHLHVPVQSGSDRILDLMRRGYSAADYCDAVRRLRESVPGMAISTDVIVGFPSSTSDDFEATRRLLDDSDICQSFIFKYSPRPGTPASELPDDVPDDEKRRRNQVLLEDQDRRSQQLHDRMVGTTVEVLVEGESLRNKSRWSGRTSTNTIVIFEPDGRLKRGDMASVRIERAMPQTLYGRLVPPSKGQPHD